MDFKVLLLNINVFKPGRNFNLNFPFSSKHHEICMFIALNEPLNPVSGTNSREGMWVVYKFPYAVVVKKKNRVTSLLLISCSCSSVDT